LLLWALSGITVTYRIWSDGELPDPRALVAARRATVSRVVPTWGDKQTLTLSRQPTKVRWLEGAKEVRVRLANGEKEKGKITFESGGHIFRHLGWRELLQSETIEVVRDLPLKLTSEGGPLAIEIEWLK
jgi:hypothetical protein